MRAASLFVAFFPGAVIVGCGITTKNLTVPSGVAAVEAAPERFAPRLDDPLLDFPPGTTTDDLSGLEGCWGAIIEDDEEFALASDAIFFRFDFDAGRLTHQTVQRSGTNNALFPFSFDVATEFDFSLSLTDDGRITGELLSVNSDTNVNDTFFGEFSDITQEEVRAVCGGEDCLSLDHSVTLIGDRFRFGASSSGDTGPPFRSDIVLIRPECPD